MLSQALQAALPFGLLAGAVVYAVCLSLSKKPDPKFRLLEKLTDRAGEPATYPHYRNAA